MSKFAKLSTIDPGYTYEMLVDFLLDNGYTGIVNDLPPEPHIEYTLFDLREVWSNLRNQL
jgi:hypothetical protein